MFYPPAPLDVTQMPEPPPHHDTPIALHQPIRALAVRIARGTWRRRTPERCPGPRAESSF